MVCTDAMDKFEQIEMNKIRPIRNFVWLVNYLHSWAYKK